MVHLRHTPNLSNLCRASAAVEGALTVDRGAVVGGLSGAVGLQYLHAWTSGLFHCRICRRVCCARRFPLVIGRSSLEGP
jgi:hypothetical protein